MIYFYLLLFKSTCFNLLKVAYIEFFCIGKIAFTFTRVYFCFHLQINQYCQTVHSMD